MSFANFRRYTTFSLPSIPDLWSDAKRMFARAIGAVGEPQAIAESKPFNRTKRREILAWFEPVEMALRRLIVAKAAIHLLMTPHGQKLLRDAKRPRPEPCEPWPDPELTPEPPKGPLKITIPYPGWNTICRLAPKPEPEPEPEPVIAPRQQPAPRTEPDTHELGAWPFRVASTAPATYSHVTSAPPEAASAATRRGPRITSFEDPLPCIPERASPAAPPSQSAPPPKPDDSRSARRCARRIVMLQRLIENPQPAILRVARYLARAAPDDIFLPRSSRRLDATHWRQGDLYADQAREHAMLGLRALHLALNWLDRPDDDPG